tara:strand:+ start:302 stop:1276 length:975 start_codon:yes stop_codon:yes gene_type:complete
MGVRLLKKFLATHYLSGIFKTGFGYIRNRKIVIDISIYIYKFKTNENLKGELKTFCQLLKDYDVNALFVFDGKNINSNKRFTIQERNSTKNKHYEEYNKLNDMIKIDDNKTDTQNSEDIQDIKNKMDKLKKKFIRLDMNDIIITKNILDAFGFKYITANGEADELCATLVKNNKAWGCLTDDTDLFIYKCPIVINYLDVINGTIVIHDLYKILESLYVNVDDFIEICIMSGTDFNKEMNGNIFDHMNNYKLYIRELNNTNTNNGFLNWLKEQKQLNEDQIIEINKVKEIYNTENKSTLMNIPYILIKNKKTDYNKLNNIMNTEN